MTQEGKRMVKYAAIGAVVGIPMPIIGPIIGGAIGAAMAWKKNNRLSGRPY